MYIKLKAVCNPDNVSDNQDFFKDPARRNIQGYRDYIDEFEEDAAGPANEVLDSLLERFDEHLFRLEEFYVSDGVFHFQWPHHDDETFLELVIRLFSILSFHQQDGLVVGDEECSVFTLRDAELHIGYRDRTDED